MTDLDDGSSRPLTRDTLVVGACTLLSRLTGFGRVLATAAVLGSGALGDVYQTANLLPNVIFELAAGGVLQAMLVPSLTAARRRGDSAFASSVGAVATYTAAALGLLALAAMTLSPVVARVLVASDPVSASRADKLDVLVPMLLVFLPQIACYGLGMVASAALAARGRFVAAALAPAANNLIVIAACIAFRSSRGGAEATLDLTPSQFLLVAAGTTLGVVAFAFVPVVALRRRHPAIRLSWRPQDDAVLALRRSFGWASLTVVATFLPTLAALLLGNGAPGGVAVFVYCFAFFALPHSLVAVPIATTLAPRVAQRVQSNELDVLRGEIARSWRILMPALCLAASGMIALAWPVTRAAAFGQTASQGIAPIAHALIAFAPGLLAYGASFVLLRVVLAAGDVRACARSMLIAGALGVIAMAALAYSFERSDRAAALAIGYGATQAIAAALLHVRLRRVLAGDVPTLIGRPLIEGVVAGAAATATMLAISAAFATSRTMSAVAVMCAGTAGVVAFVAVLAVLRRGKLDPRRP